MVIMLDDGMVERRCVVWLGCRERFFAIKKQNGNRAKALCQRIQLDQTGHNRQHVVRKRIPNKKY